MAVGVKILLAALITTLMQDTGSTNGDCVNLALDNGEVTYTKSRLHKRGVVVDRRPAGTIAVFKCNKGYALLNNEQRLCESGSWSGHSSNTTCQVNSCGLKFQDSGGCCTEKVDACYVGDVNTARHCSCSAECYTNSSLPCCPDIGCHRETCAKANLAANNCDWTTDNLKGCYVPDNHCRCDQKCCERDGGIDCCPDVTCPESNERAEASDDVLIGDAAAKELAGILRSMSQAQQLSSKQQTAELDAILSELQEIQNEEWD